MSFSNTYENKVMDHLFGKGAPLTPVYPISVGLLTANPGDAGTSLNCNEVANANNYSRVVTIAGNWTLSTGGIISNADAIVFPGAAGSWGTVTHFALFDSQLYGIGNLLIYGVLALAKLITLGYITRFNSGQLTLALD